MSKLPKQIKVYDKNKKIEKIITLEEIRNVCGRLSIEDIETIVFNEDESDEYIRIGIEVDTNSNDFLTFDVLQNISNLFNTKYIYLKGRGDEDNGAEYTPLGAFQHVVINIEVYK